MECKAHEKFNPEQPYGCEDLNFSWNAAIRFLQPRYRQNNISICAVITLRNMHTG